MIVPIKSIHDLRNEIVRLETLTKQQEVSIKQRFSSPSAIYKTIVSAFSNPSEGNSPGKQVKLNGLLNQDIIGAISKFLLPLTLNKTLFKGSGFITKSIVTFLSKKASGYINQDNVTSGFDKFKTMLSKVKPLDSLLSKLKSPAKKSIVLAKPATASTPIVVKKLD